MPLVRRILVQDEGVLQGAATLLNAVGAGISASVSGGVATLNVAGGGPGSGTVVTAGTTTVNFGAFPGSSDTSVTITGQASIVAGSTVFAWLRYADSADHLADEHLLETIRVTAGNIVAGSGFTIYAANSSQLNEPLAVAGVSTFRSAAATVYGLAGQAEGGIGTRIYGQWSVGWLWF